MRIHENAVPTKEFRELLWKAFKATRPELAELFTPATLWDAFRQLKMIELAAAGTLGTVSTVGIDAVSLGVSNKLQRPYLRKKVSQMVMRFIQGNPEYCRKNASSDHEENLRRILTFLDGFFPQSEKSIPTDL